MSLFDIPPSELVGCLAWLTIRRLGPAGAFMVPEDASHDAEEILLPVDEVPDHPACGQWHRALVYRSSEGELVASLRPPKLVLGEVAFLEVTGLTSFGTFFAWGPPKDILVPLAEQTRELAVGEAHPVGLYRDTKGRLTGTMKVAEMLTAKADLDEGEWVTGEAWRKEPEIGVFVIVEKKFLGLVPAAEPNALARGESASFRVTRVHPDGNIELSLRRPGHEEIEDDASHVLDILGELGTPSVRDRTSPEEIRAIFGLSKKAWKRAVGRLLRRGDAWLDEMGYVTVGKRK